MWFSKGGERVRETFEAALAWCESCNVVTDAPTAGDRGDAVWTQLGQSPEKVRAAILSNLEVAAPELMNPLYEANRVRRFIEGAPRVAHFVSFERGGEMRFLLAADALRASTLEAPGMWLFWEGERGALPDGLQAIFDECWSTSVPVSAEEFASGPASGSVVTPYSRPIPSVREVLGIRSTRDYFELDPDDQEAALWSTLIGEGAVDVVQAVRLGAERLRAQGFLDYQRLHQDGRVYAAIEERLLAARRRTDLFDRPRNGFVRAIRPDIDGLTAEQWRDCLMGALDEGARVDRDEAVRLGFENAQTTYGVNAQRLRTGGKADQALRSAINSAVRQGYLTRDGAAYLVRVAPPEAPTLRGLIRVEPSDDGRSERDAQVPASVVPVTVEVAPPSAPAPITSLPEGSATPPLVPEPEPVAPLDRDLQTLPLPTRALNWAARREIATVRELVTWKPEAFEQEKNVGRGTVRETREVIESLLGYSWEEAHLALHGGAAAISHSDAATTAEDDSATDSLTAGGATGWAAIAARLSDEERHVSLLDVQLPTRMKNFVRAEGIERLGDLFKLSHASLAATANLGRKSLNDTLDAVRDFLGERASPPVYTTFLQAWQAQLAVLEPIPRMIVTRRAGMHGARETLEEIGAMLGVTRERVRQIETLVVERLAERSRWRRSVEANLSAAFGSGRALPLDLLARDSWWAGIDQQELLLDYVVRRIFEDQLFVLEAPSGKLYLTKFGPSDFVAHLESAKSRVAKLEYPIEERVIAEILHAEADVLDPILYTELKQAVDELLHRDPEQPGLALGYGRYRTDELLAFLNGQAEPVPVALVEEACGRGSMPDEVLYFKRGVVGLKRHFPDFDGWMERLVPAALEIMKERPIGRQWLVPEIHELLREKGALPEWLGHWHLASLLRLSGKVDYLGRLRVASKDAGQERLQYEALLEQILRRAGTPLNLDGLIALARVQTDVPEASASSTTLTAPFIRLDESRVGLLDRDVPGGPTAVAAAIEAVVKSLNETQLGLTPYQATSLVNALSDVHASWTTSMVLSLLRNEASVRIDRTRNIGLDEWDDVRCPSRSEFLRRELQQRDGQLPLHEFSAKMERTYGRAPDRAEVWGLAQQVGLTLVGEMISRPSSEPVQTSVERVGINLTGIPAELREKFQEYVDLAPREVLTLRKEVKQHLDEMAKAYEVNEFVDLAGAQLLAGQCNLLLDHWQTLPASARRLAHAAIHYFISWEDVENDLDIGGLDDDKQIMNAVLAYLGLEVSSHGALAS